jgi:hypothetical protein
MNVENVILDSLDGFDRRILIRNGEPYACVSDLYNQLEIPRKTLMSIIDNNVESFKGYIIKVNSNDLQEDENQPWRNVSRGSLFQRNTIYNFINESGYNLLIQKINPDTVRDESKRDIIIKHQRGMAEVFAKYRRNEVTDAKNVQPTIHPAMRSPEQVCKDKIDLGNFLADIFGIPKQMAATVSINEAQRETGVDFSNYQKLLPPVDGTYEEPKIGAQDLGKPYGDNGRKVNLLLQKLGYIYKDNGKWQLTQMGKDYGGAWFPFTAPNGHTDTHLRWPTKIKDVIKEHENFFR